MAYNSQMAPILPWIEILTAENIPFVTRGSSVSRDHIAIHCPWCGPEDPSHHLGIALNDAAWGCWRNATHRGRRPHKLLFKLLGNQAAQYLPPDPEQTALTALELSGIGSRFELRAQPREPLQDRSREWDQFHPIPPGHPLRAYAQSRGMSSDFFNQCDLRYIPHGPLRWRLLIPLRWDGMIFGWTGRAGGSLTPRYLNSSQTDSCAAFRTCSEPHRTIAVEGPWDALRLTEGLDALQDEHSEVIATLGISLSAAKRAQLRSIPNLIFGWDADAWAESTITALELCAQTLPPPPGRTDWGEATTEEIRSWIQQNVKYS